MFPQSMTLQPDDCPPSVEEGIFNALNFRIIFSTIELKCAWDVPSVTKTKSQ